MERGEGMGYNEWTVAWTGFWFEWPDYEEREGDGASMDDFLDDKECA